MIKNTNKTISHSELSESCCCRLKLSEVDVRLWTHNWTEPELHKHAKMIMLWLYLWSGLNVMWWGTCTATIEMYFPQVTAMWRYCRRYRIFIPLSVEIVDAPSCILPLLAFECIHSVIGTLDIHPVHRACLTLHGIWFLWKCNHGLEDCFLLSRSENDKLVEGGRRMFQMSLSLQGYFLYMLSFIVLGVWWQCCWWMWLLSLMDALWGPTQHTMQAGEHYTSCNPQNLLFVLLLKSKLETNCTRAKNVTALRYLIRLLITARSIHYILTTDYTLAF